MVLSAGTRLGLYEILAPVGAGGMGEVYRARDTKLQRDVAIKILPALFASDPERLARFEREAQLLAALNHPNIAQIYGSLDAGDSTDRVTALVMELVAGEDLTERITRGALPLDEALAVAKQIADALEAAHEQGIIHRDLKPANVKVRADGAVKVLDFGLAKALGSGDGSPLDGGTGLPSPDAANSPTLTSPARLRPGYGEAGTRLGVILGTAAYMAPEQARGRPVDRRADVWAFGCVLYEMLTGRRTFGGDDVTDTLAAVLRAEPEWGALPADTPPALHRLLRRCLEKDPRRRLRDIADVRLELDEALGRPAESDSRVGISSPVAAHARMRERVAWIIAGASVTALVVALGLSLRQPPDDPAEGAGTYNATILLPEGVRLWAGAMSPWSANFPSGRMALSPDGRWLALVASDSRGRPLLWVRPLDSAIPRPLAGTEDASFPSWSPDSRSIAFLVDGKLKKIDAAGGQALTLCDASVPASAAWSKDDVILFTPKPNSPLHRVSASGGTPTPVTTLDAAAGDVQHWYPFFLPNGRHFLYSVVGSRSRGMTDPRAVYLGSLDPNEPARLLLESGSNAKYANRHLVYVRGGALLAWPFDPDRLEFAGEPVPLVEQVQIASAGSTGMAGAFAVSETGVLAFQTASTVRSQLTWFDRGGKEIGRLGDQADYADVALSPDETRAAVSLLDSGRGTRDLWLFDLARGLRERFTSDPGDDFAPVWLKPDGDRLVFSSQRQEGIHLYQKPLRGADADTLLLDDSLGKFASHASPDGRFVAYVGGGGSIQRSDVWLLPLAGDRKAYPLLQTPFVESQPQFSPDGRWIAYMTNESGRQEVYVRPFAGADDKWQVSSAGGGWPRWRRDGKEIFYLAPDGTLTAVPVNGQGTRFEVGTGRPLFTVRTRPLARLDAYNYDVTADGQRFLVNTFVEQPIPNVITLVVNWPAALKK